MKFSRIEIKELFKAWFFISLAFAILFSGGFSGSFSYSFLYLVIISGLTVGMAFLVHEIMHKFMAQKYGYLAEFRAFDKMLWLALIMSFFGFILAAPGAVMIKGRVNKEENGKISSAGPLSNLILALIFLPFFFMNFEGILNTFFRIGFFINSILAFFNLLPIPGFDGRKIMEWNKIFYGILFVIAIVLLIFAFAI